ncbi:hypothetical protein [Thalassolituus marinus]|uniref:Uncharacterized protein n=1 Tax=Thalassolituus marinus TaxID=671053 RepID=A0ABS7ZXX1_9GAMM|nr:hypothetical protein [Thalassolituus marinus]MCA6065460.1 hypothetical protein [Thalassolituus marinus]
MSDFQFQTAVHEVHVEHPFSEQEIEEVRAKILPYLHSNGVEAVFSGAEIFDGEVLAYKVTATQNAFYLNLKSVGVEHILFSGTDCPIIGTTIVALHHVAPCSLRVVDTPFDHDDWIEWAEESGKIVDISDQSEPRFMPGCKKLKALIGDAESDFLMI